MTVELTVEQCNAIVVLLAVTLDQMIESATPELTPEVLDEMLKLLSIFNAGKKECLDGQEKRK